MRSRTHMLAAAAVIAAGTFTGCGGSSDDEKADGPITQTTAEAQAKAADAALAKVKAAPVPAKGSAERTWARELCTALGKAGTPLAQPQVNSSNVDRAQRSLVRFFGQLGDQLGTQQQALERVGAPPIDGTEKQWKLALDGMSTVRTMMATVKKQTAAADVKTTKDLDRLMEQMGQSMNTLSMYRGPVSTLAGDPKTGPAVQAEPRCRRFI